MAHVQTAAERLGLQSPACQAALDASVHLLGSMSGLLESCCACWSAGDPPPGWLPGMPQQSVASGSRMLGLACCAAAAALCHCAHQHSTLLCLRPLPFAGILRLFSLVPEAASATAGPLVTILHTDLLNCWCQLGPVIMPLLQAQHQQVSTHTEHASWWHGICARICGHNSHRIVLRAPWSRPLAAGHATANSWAGTLCHVRLPRNRGCAGVQP